ncbi:MAG: Uma2 family endonuclease [Planctomycetes bacterium]|nr:Uma2 family endonuclease [Planctomycetota bacterium]
MIQKHSMTAEDLLAMPSDGNSYELVRGELRMMTPAGFEHGRIAMRIGSRINQHVERNKLGVVLAAETGFTLERDPDTVRAPDVSFVHRDRIPSPSERQKFAELAPDLAVEVISPSNRTIEIDEKISDYLNAGVRLVWVVYPETQSVAEHRPNTPAKEFDLEDTLQGYDVLPDFTCAMADLFG